MNIFYELITAGGALSTLSATLLIVASFFTSLITASLGIGGGVLLLAILASTLPITALIPVHGLVQLGSTWFISALKHEYTQPQRVLVQISPADPV